MKLFFILGNQLFPTKYIDRFKKDHTFFMAEDKGLCTYENTISKKFFCSYLLCDPTPVSYTHLTLPTTPYV